MESQIEYLEVTYKEFTLFVAAIEGADGLWRIDYQVYLRRTKIAGGISPEEFATKALAGNAAENFAIGIAEQWRLAFEQEQGERDPGHYLLVWGVLYSFDSALEAAAARKWLVDNNATHDEFAAMYGSRQARNAPRGYGF